MLMHLVRWNTFIIGLLLFTSVFVVAGIHFGRYFEEKRQDRYTTRYTDYAYSHEGRTIFSWCYIILIGIIASVLFLSMISAIVQNKTIEQAVYDGCYAECVSINQALGVSGDEVVKSDLYLRAADYNKTIAEYKAYYNAPAYSLNFSGRVDWNTLPTINIPEALGRS